MNKYNLRNPPRYSLNVMWWVTDVKTQITTKAEIAWLHPVIFAAGSDRPYLALPIGLRIILNTRFQYDVFA